MKIVTISDTHTFQDKMKYNIPKCDVIIHSGDVSLRGTEDEVRKFLFWYDKLPHKNKIFIAGNHDFFFDTGYDGIQKSKRQIYSKEEVSKLISEFPSIVYLNDSGIEIDGVKFWGSPISPFFHDWAFNRERGEEIKKHWDLIPKDTTVLITHGPVHTILDRVDRGGELVGCEELLKTISTLKDLKLHVCGHIHEAYGMVEKDGVTFVNASICNLSYEPSNKPIVIKI